MSIVVRFSPQNLTKEQYDATTEKMEQAGVEFPPEGLELHVCFGSDGDLRVSEVWDSREQFEAFSERLIPALTDAGIEFSGDPEIFDAHHVERRS
jgi:hypothetical protein